MYNKNSKICLQFVSIYAAYLYDSVKLYAWALDKLLKQEERPLDERVIHEIASNGTRIIETIIKNRTYKSKHIYTHLKLTNELKCIIENLTIIRSWNFCRCNWLDH